MREKVALNEGTSGASVLNNIVKDNIAGLLLSNDPSDGPATIQNNLFRTNNNFGSLKGIGIYTDDTVAGGPVANVLINNNKLVGHVGPAIVFGSSKGGGVLALYNEAAGQKGLALIVYDAGNTDALALVTVDQAGKLVALKSVALGNKIKENAWYRLSMAVTVTGVNFSVTASVSCHMVSTDPNSGLNVPAVGTLSFGPVTLFSKGLLSMGEVGIIASAVSAVVDTSVTNFTIGP